MCGYCMNFADDDIYATPVCAALESTIQETSGCTYIQASNYNVQATTDDGSCIFPDASCPADLNTDGRYGPTGRFIYKSKNRYGIESKDNLYNDIINEANQKKDNWEKLKAGFFSASYEKFIKVANNYKKFMESINWH